MAFKGKKGKSIGIKRKAGDISNKKNTKFQRILVSCSSIRGQVQTSKTTRAQREITSFFKPTPKPVSPSHIPLDKNAFKMGYDGKDQSTTTEKAASMRKLRHVQTLKNALLNTKLSFQQKSLTLYTLSQDPEVAAIIRTAGMSKLTIDAEIAIHNDNNIKEIIELALKTNHIKGRANDDQRSFIESILVACASSLNSNKNHPSQKAIIKHFNLPNTTGKRKLKEAKKKRQFLCSSKNKNAQILWAHVKKREKYQKVSEPIRRKLYDWIINHHSIIPSPSMNDTLLIQNRNNPLEKIRVPKLLRNCSMRELHNDLIAKSPEGFPDAYDADGNILISDTALRALMPPNIKKFTNRYKETCGCEVCILSNCFQNSLNDFRISTIKRFEKDPIDKTRATRYKKLLYKDNKLIHEKPRDALKAIQCKEVNGFNVPRLKCILRKCTKCPKYLLHDEETKPDEDRPYIKFHIFEIVPSCSIHLTQPMDATECTVCKTYTKRKKRESLE